MDLFLNSLDLLVCLHLGLGSTLQDHFLVFALYVPRLMCHLQHVIVLELFQLLVKSLVEVGPLGVLLLEGLLLVLDIFLFLDFALDSLDFFLLLLYQVVVLLDHGLLFLLVLRCDLVLCFVGTFLQLCEVLISVDFLLQLQLNLLT